METTRATLTRNYAPPEEAMRLFDKKTIDEEFPNVPKSQLESRLNQLEAGRQAMLHERCGTVTYIRKGKYGMLDKECRASWERSGEEEV